MPKDPYQILQIAEHAEIEVIEAAFRRLALKYHPDHNPDSNATERMRDIAWAYDQLRDSGRHANNDLLRNSDPEQLEPVPERRTEFFIEPEMLHVPAGPFILGSKKNDMEAFQVEKLAHTVDLQEFRIARHPVTNAAYHLFLLDNLRFSPPYSWKGLDHPLEQPDHPVVGASWLYAIAYCRWLSRQTEKKYILPSEAEWEKAARGPRGSKFPWGNQWDPNRCNNLSDGIYTSTRVNTYSPHGDSVYGCSDMSGNVWEWTRSIFLDYPYRPHDGREGLKAAIDSEVVVRGGAFNSKPRSVRCACRDRAFPSYGNRSVGFRIVISPAFEED